MDLNEALTVSQVAERLNVSSQRVRQLLAEGKILAEPHSSGQKFINVTEVERFVRDRREAALSRFTPKLTT